MSETPNFLAIERVAVVTGGNRGIGLEICRQLASKGVIVILTARDEKKGVNAIDKLIKECGISDYFVHFHKLDLTDTSTIPPFKDFINDKFGKLDILVNNAGALGIRMDVAANQEDAPPELFFKKIEVAIQTYDLTEECLKTNYYGPKLLTEELLPLLQLSDSPRLVNVSSEIGTLKFVRNKWAIEMLSDHSGDLTEDKVDEVLNHFLKDFKDGLLEIKNWPPSQSAYILSKATINAYTRILAKKYPNFIVNCVCPGYVKTDMTNNQGILTVEEGAKSSVWLALLPQGGPSGKFFSKKEVISF